MIDVEWDAAAFTRDLVDDNWSSSVDRPQHIRLRTEDERGNPQKGVDYTQEYVIISEVDERGFEYRDGPMDVADASVTVFLEVATPNGRSRRNELWDELMRIAVAARKRSLDSPGTPGTWDTLVVNGNSVPDENFGWSAFNQRWRYEAKARTI